MKYNKTLKQKRNEILSTFSKEEFKTLCEKVFSFSGLNQEGADYLRLIKRTSTDFPERPSEEVVAGKIWDDELKNKALIGLGVGAGLGGIYGAFKSHRSQKDKVKDMLKYGLIGAGLGGVGGGLAGAYSYNQKDVKSIDPLMQAATDIVDTKQIEAVENQMQKNNELVKTLIADAESKNNDESKKEVSKAIKKSGILFNDPTAIKYVVEHTSPQESYVGKFMDNVSRLFK